jgi:hypothetical protein
MTALARCWRFRIASLFRPAVRLVLIAVGLWRLTSLAVSAYPLLSQAIPFTICKESTTWTRATASLQAKIWSDARYSDHGAKAYEWNHQFLVVPSDSTSIQYHAGNEAGCGPKIRLVRLAMTPSTSTTTNGLQPGFSCTA